GKDLEGGQPRSRPWRCSKWWKRTPADRRPPWSWPPPTASWPAATRLCRWLAAGGMGQVWQAVDEVLGRPVAVKLLRDEHAQDPSFVRRLRAEARSAAAVTHPGVASVFDYGEVRTAAGAAPTPFLVMELVEGEPLS